MASIEQRWEADFALVNASGALTGRAGFEPFDRLEAIQAEFDCCGFHQWGQQAVGACIFNQTELLSVPDTEGCAAPLGSTVTAVGWGAACGGGVCVLVMVRGLRAGWG